MIGIFVLAKLALFWLAVAGLDSRLRALLPDSLIVERRIPKTTIGLSALMLLSIILAISGFLKRPVLIGGVLVLAVLALPEIISATRRYLPILKKPTQPMAWILGFFLVFLLAGNILRALRPHGLVDPLIIYAVRPDRWLTAGTLVPLAQSKFTGSPILGELLAVWPASLAAGRTEQLVLLQLFQTTMLFASAAVAARIMRLRAKATMVVISTVLGIPILSSWGSVAKTDMTALYYMTIAFALLFSDIVSDARGRPAPVAWAAAGIAMGVKYTVLPGVIALFLGSLSVSEWRQRIPKCLAIAVLIPLGTALRNLLLTGNPVYPYLADVFSSRSEWHLSYPEAIQAIRTRPKVSFPASLSALIPTWSSGGVLFLLGLGALAVQRKMREPYILMGIALAYAAICSMLFNPMPWGAKYAFLVLPAMVAIGVASLSALRIRADILLTVALIPLLLFSEMPQRMLFVGESSRRFLEEPHFSGSDVPPTLGLHLWVNEHLPEDATLLSLWRTERYFCDREVLVAQNSPLGLGLFSSKNGLKEEIELLDSMDVDYIYFFASDPLPVDLETNLQILQPGAFSRLFTPLVEIDGYVICQCVMTKGQNGGDR